MVVFQTGMKWVPRWRRCMLWCQTQWRALRATAPGGMLHLPPDNLPELTPCLSERWKRKKTEGRGEKTFIITCRGPPWTPLNCAHTYHTLNPYYSWSHLWITPVLSTSFPNATITTKLTYTCARVWVYLTTFISHTFTEMTTTPAVNYIPLTITLLKQCMCGWLCCNNSVLVTEFLSMMVCTWGNKEFCFCVNNDTVVWPSTVISKLSKWITLQCTPSQVPPLFLSQSFCSTIL